MSKADEKWLPLDGYIGYYDVSNHGNVRSVTRMTRSRHGFKTSNGKILKPQISKNGYYRIYLSKEGVSIRKLIHRLVATMFVDNKCCKPTVNHINGIKTDNKATNLEWSTQKEQLEHARDNGLLHPLSGDRHPLGKKTHCIRNHEFLPKNIYVPKNGSRQCIECCRIRTNKLRAELREKINKYYGDGE